MDLKKKVFAELDRSCRQRRHPRLQHLQSRHQRNRRGDEASGGCNRHAFLQPGQHHETARDRARREDRRRSAGDGARAWPRPSTSSRWWRGSAMGSSPTAPSIPTGASPSSWSRKAPAPYEVDQVLYDFGMPMGPFAVADLVGLDVGQLIRKNASAEAAAGRALLGHLEDDVVALGRLGQKNGLGWYRLRCQCAFRHAGSADRERDRRLSPEARLRAPEDLGRGDHRALHLCRDQRGQPRSWRKASPSAPPTSTWPPSTASAFPAGAAGRCNMPTRSDLPTVAAAVERFHGAHGYWWEPSKLLLDLAKSGRKFGAD